MKNGLYLVKPAPGMIIQIYVRYCHFDFLHGFCRGLLHAGLYVQFIEGFRRHENPEMTIRWAEACDFGIRPLEQFSFELAPEAEWMTRPKPNHAK